MTPGFTEIYHKVTQFIYAPRYVQRTPPGKVTPLSNFAYSRWPEGNLVSRDLTAHLVLNAESKACVGYLSVAVSTD